MGPGFGAAAVAYLMIVPAIIFAIICIAIGVGFGWLIF